MMNVRPGDLAICVGTELKANEGVILRVVRRHTNDERWNFGATPAWWCVSDEVMTWFFRGSGECVKAHEGPVPDACLRPIRPRQPDATTRTAGAPSRSLHTNDLGV